MTYIKICGLTNADDATVAADAGADYLGFIFVENTPRYITPEHFATFAHVLPKTAARVGVFVNGDPDLIARLIADGLIDYAQLHGDESPTQVNGIDRAYKSIRPKTRDDLADSLDSYTQSLQPFDHKKPSLLIDAYHPKLYGGTGEAVNRDLILQAKARVDRLMIAGGLTPDTVAGTVRAVAPFAVDVSSGVEASPGRKDHGKIRAFIQAARG